MVTEDKLQKDKNIP